MSYGVPIRRVCRQVVRRSGRSESVLSEEEWHEYNIDIGEYHVVNDPLVLSSSEDEMEVGQEHNTEDSNRRIERWMSGTGDMRVKTPEIVEFGFEEREEGVAPYLSEKLEKLTRYQLQVVRQLVVEMFPILPRHGPSAGGSIAVTSGSDGGKYRLPSVIV